MPITYMQREIPVKLWNQETSMWDTQTTISAQAASNGLAYHLSIYTDHLPPDWILTRRFGPDFTITHVNSGHRFFGGGQRLLRTPQQCQRIIRLLERVFDWTGEAETIRAQSRDLIPTVRSVVKHVLKEKEN